MPRSAVDATRFTATGPYANSKSSKSAAYLAFAPRAPPGETPREKVARLREAARRAKLNEISTFDRVVLIGRVWADRLHRVTAYSLIAASGIAGLITMYAMGDMMIYNRRKRNEWYIDQEQRRAKALVLAREAAAQGTANENQILLLNQERAAEEAEEERRGKRGIFKRVKQMFYAGLSIEEHSFRTIPGGGEGTEETQAQVESGPPSDNAGSSIVAAVEDIKGKVSGPTVGPLDRLAADVAQAGTTGSRSWSSWAKGR